MKPPARISSVPNSGAWACLALSILSGREPVAHLRSERLVIVRATEEELEDVLDGIRALRALFPSLKDVRPALFNEDPVQRLAALERLHRGAPVVLASASSLGLPAPALEEYAERRLRVCPGDLPRSRLLGFLERSGYRRADFAESPGEYAARGAVVDFFPIEPPEPVRVLYDGDRIESLRRYDPSTQASIPEIVDEAAVVPAREKDGGGTLGEALAGRGLWLADASVEDAALPDGAARVGAGEGADFGASAVMRAGKTGMDTVVERVKDWKREGLKVLLFAMNRGEDERLQEMLEDRLPAGSVQHLIGPLRHGFLSRPMGLAALSSGEIFGRSWRAGKVWKTGISERAKVRFGELKKGDYVVHELYGISRYLGLEGVATGDPHGEAVGESSGVMDCLRLEFRGGDALFVPMAEFKCVQKYVGAEGHRPRLSSLDTKTWGEVVGKVREGVRELARELIKTHAARKAAPGHAFPADSRMESEFAESFPFDETPDQRRAIEEVKADMTAPHTMDRVVVGDVGFGKTEVAMRAALKCAAGARQTAVLVPTTVLADQHARTFRKRFAEYPVRVEMLSRFQTRAQQKKTLRELAAGKVDVVVGTHRLLQADVSFRDLGLLVIDEEHRFGVRSKEKLKGMRKNLDCLSLSATPIPRTLHQCMSGLREVSLIQSAPMGRLPIVTEVRSYDENHVARAIQAELDRGGQVFYVYNKVRSLPEKKKSLEALLPGVRFCMAHGQMRSESLEKTMWDFFGRKHDVLVASSIIESGLDIPTVNSLLIENAQDFGLSQLYQLRGRIGRERQRAYCFLYYPEDAGGFRELSEEARKRLEALREFGTLGSGFNLAMRDLEIRGAGDLLGSRQHGFLNAVGVEFYSELLEAEVERLRGRRPEKAPPPPAHLDLGLSAHIPQDYLPGDLERIQFYKRALAADKAALDALERELADLSGPLPGPVRELFRILRIRLMATGAHVRTVVRRGGRVELYFHRDSEVPTEAIARWMSAYKDRIEFVRSSEGDGLRVQLGRRDPVAWLLDFLQGLQPA